MNEHLLLSLGQDRDFLIYKIPYGRWDVDHYACI